MEENVLKVPFFSMNRIRENSTGDVKIIITKRHVPIRISIRETLGDLGNGSGYVALRACSGIAPISCLRTEPAIAVTQPANVIIVIGQLPDKPPYVWKALSGSSA